MTKTVCYRPESERFLDSERLLLEPLRVAHAAQLFASLRDEALIFIDRPDSLVELEGKYGRWEARGPDDGSEVWLNWAARDKSTSSYIGWFQATLVTGAPANLSFVVFPPFWRRGYATEATHVIIRHLVEVYRSGHFILTMDPQNSASAATARKLGFSALVSPDPAELRFELVIAWPRALE